MSFGGNTRRTYIISRRPLLFKMRGTFKDRVLKGKWFYESDSSEVSIFRYFFSFSAIFAQESRNVTVRLKTRPFSEESIGSTQK